LWWGEWGSGESGLFLEGRVGEGEGGLEVKGEERHVWGGKVATIALVIIIQGVSTLKPMSRASQSLSRSRPPIPA